MEVIVTDHHQAGEELPDCLILHPEISELPVRVALRDRGRLEARLRSSRDVDARPGSGCAGDGRRRGPAGRREPVAGQARAGRDAPGAAAGAEGADGGRRNASRLGWTRAISASGLAPRINAAGRLYRADAGVELLLTEDEGRAEEIAIELSRANSERRATEREVDAAAEPARRELPDELREARGLVLAGEDWHPGVVGIVASRLVERHQRPVVVISLDGEGGGRGSGRSIPGFDLLAALEACSEHLESFGGHRAAAGLSLRAENLDAFRDGLRRPRERGARPGGPAADRADRRDGRRRRPRPRPGRGARPAGAVRDGQPRRAADGALGPGQRRADDGEEGKHARFSLHSGSHRALGVAFGRSSLGVEDEDPVDAAVRLEVNHWNGSVEPRVVLRELYPLAAVEGAPPAAPLRLRARPSGGRASRPSWPATWPSLEGARMRSTSTPGLRTRDSRRRLGDRADRRAGLQRRRRARGLRRRLAPGGARQRRHRAGALQRRRGAGRLPPLRRRRDRRPGRARAGRPRADRLRRRSRWPPSSPPPSSTSSSSTRRPAPSRRPAPRSPAPSAGFLHPLWSRGRAGLRPRGARRAARLAGDGRPRLPRPARAPGRRRRGAARRRSRAAAPTPSTRRPRRALSAFCASSASLPGSRMQAAASSASYPQRGPIWSAQPRSGPISERFSEALQFLERPKLP